MKVYRICANDMRVENIAAAICESEDLWLDLSFGTDALGDDYIDVSGSNAEVDVFKEVFEMVYC